MAPNTVIAPGPTSQSFVYDDLYQLANASGTYRGCACGCDNTRNYSLTMQYDGIGNITRKTQTDTIFKPSGQATPQVATTYNNAYAYDPAPQGRPHAPTGVGGPSGNTTIGYDANGNQTQYSGTFGPSRTLTWTEDDRLRTEIDSGFTTSFLYDAEGNRSHKRRTTLETWYVNPFYVIKNSLAESKHIMLGDQKIVTALATITNRADPTTAGPNTLFYYHPDHIQSTSYVTGGDGSILQHDEYFPSGEVWFQEQKNNDARNTQPYLFSAKELDETGLYYFGARYYNPKLSVWTSPDPILASYMQGETNDGVFQPRNLGLYGYAWNNPIKVIDPDGLAVQVQSFKQGDVQLNFQLPRNDEANINLRPGEVYLGTFDATVKGQHTTFIAVGREGEKAPEYLRQHFRTSDSANLTVDQAKVLVSLQLLSMVFGGAALGMVKSIGKKGINWAWKSKPTFGHTFNTHGAGAKVTRRLTGRAVKEGPQGQWLNNEAAADFLRSQRASLNGLAKGKAASVEIPPGLGQVILPNGSIVPATRATLVPRAGGGYASAFPTL